jgi:hypothetical protein
MGNFTKPLSGWWLSYPQVFTYFFHVHISGKLDVWIK